MRVWIKCQIIKHVAEVDVGHVAKRYQMRKADASRGRPVQNGRQHGARLGDKRHAPRRR